MSQRLYSFLVVFLLIFSEVSFGQQISGSFSAPTPSDSMRLKKYMPSQLAFPSKNYLGYADCTYTPQFILLKIVPASYYSTHLGFFCKKELQLDKVIAVPLRFRLGSLAYVNYLEQKPNAHNPQR